MKCILNILCICYLTATPQYMQASWDGFFKVVGIASGVVAFVEVTKAVCNDDPSSDFTGGGQTFATRTDVASLSSAHKTTEKRVQELQKEVALLRTLLFGTTDITKIDPAKYVSLQRQFVAAGQERAQLTQALSGFTGRFEGINTTLRGLNESSAWNKNRIDEMSTQLATLAPTFELPEDDSNHSN